MKSKNIMLTLLALSATALLAGCGQGGGNTPSSEKTAVQKVVEEAEKLDRTELFKKAAAELGNNTFHWLATSSRGGKVKKEFVAALNEAAGTQIKEDQIDYQTTVDGKIYTFLNAEIESGNATYSGALLQDGYQLQTKGIANGYVNYVPKEWNDKAGVKKDRDANPFSLQFNFKTWMYNDKANNMVIDNVWDFLKEGVTIDTMDPTNENVNMDWLIQLTSDDNCDILKAAFDDPSNSSGLTAADLDAYKNYGEKRKYAFLFIEKYIKNASFYADDGKALDAFKAAPGHAAWIVYSKIQNVTESAEVTKKDIVIAALGKNHSDGKNATMAMKGFGGFMYKHYLMLTPKSPLPWTACAFINFLSTTKVGYSKWAGDVGDYPTYGEEINVDRTMNGHGTLDADYKWTQDATKPNVFPCLNDPTANWWIDTAKSTVETPSYIATYYNTVNAFIQKEIAKKK